MLLSPKKKRKNFKLPADIPVFYAENKTISPYTENTKLVAFAGIGYPKKFFAELKNVTARRAYPDHYLYTDKDITELINLADKKGAKLVTTEKDWVRLPVDVQKQIKFARLETKIDNAFFDWLKEKLNANVEKNG